MPNVLCVQGVVIASSNCAFPTMPTINNGEQRNTTKRRRLTKVAEIQALVERIQKHYLDVMTYVILMWFLWPPPMAVKPPVAVFSLPPLIVPILQLLSTPPHLKQKTVKHTFKETYAPARELLLPPPINPQQLDAVFQYPPATVSALLQTIVMSGCEHKHTSKHNSKRLNRCGYVIPIRKVAPSSTDSAVVIQRFVRVTACYSSVPVVTQKKKKKMERNSQRSR